MHTTARPNETNNFSSMTTILRWPEHGGPERIPNLENVRADFLVSHGRGDTLHFEVAAFAVSRARRELSASARAARSVATAESTSRKAAADEAAESLAMQPRRTKTSIERVEFPCAKRKT